MRQAIVKHFYNIPEYIADSKNGTAITADVAAGGKKVTVKSVQEYLKVSKMDKNRTWGTEREVLVMAHLLKTPIYAYSVSSIPTLNTWQSVILTALILPY